MKKKHLNTLKIASLTLMLGCFAVGGIYNHYQDKQQDHVVKVEKNNLQAPKQYISYNDDDYTITFNDNELNTYTWDNLANVFVNIYQNSSFNNMTFYLVNDEITLTYDEYVGNDVLMYVATDYQIIFNFDGNTFEYYYNSAEDYFNQPLRLWCEDDYNALKTAIELDIQANQPVSMGDSIISSIASGLGMIPNIAGEFLAGFSKLLWNNNQLTDFAIYSLVFLGIAITFAIVKLVLMIVRNNTGA